MPDLCLTVITSRSKYHEIQARLCQRERGHAGRHDERPFLRDLLASNPQVANKIIRDAIMTTGAAWKSEDAGPNRILRWVMLLTDEELEGFGVRMNQLKPQVVTKLREKAATYEDCIEVAKKLTWLVYQMPDSPAPSDETRIYLEDHFGELQADSTVCMVCREPLSFELFSGAMRGKAIIETGHSNPRTHNAANVGFAHRECNIAQGSKTLPEFYAWIKEILARAE
jgi:hypothetical protein